MFLEAYYFEADISFFSIWGNLNALLIYFDY